MRATPKRFIKTLFFGSLLCFVVVNLNLFLNASNDPGPPQAGAPGNAPNNPDISTSNGLQNGGIIAGPVRSIHGFNNASNGEKPNRVVLNTKNPHEGVPVGTGNLRDSNASQYAPVGLDPNLEAIKRAIRTENLRQRILNLDKFDLKASDSTVVIVVQVHDRTDYLQHLIDSLRRAKGIEQTLLIFSHDVYIDEVNVMVQKIEFCPVSTHHT